jgi:hypothetical protein
VRKCKLHLLTGFLSGFFPDFFGGFWFRIKADLGDKNREITVSGSEVCRVLYTKDLCSYGVFFKIIFRHWKVIYQRILYPIFISQSRKKRTFPITF